MVDQQWNSIQDAQAWQYWIRRKVADGVISCLSRIQNFSSQYKEARRLGMSRSCLFKGIFVYDRAIEKITQLVRLKNSNVSLCIITWALHLEDVWGEWRYSSMILFSVLGRCGWLASRPSLYNRWKCPHPWYSMNRWLGKPHKPAVEAMEKILILPCRESNPDRPSRTYTD